WQRPLERRRLRAASLLVPWDTGSLEEIPRSHAAVVVVVPIAVDPAPATGAPRDIAAITYAANPHKKGLDRVLAAWAQARRGDEQLVVAGADLRLEAPGVRVAGRLAPAEYRHLLGRARVFVTAPRREDYGIAQLEALADGCTLVTTTAPGPYAALPIARARDPRLVVDRPDDPAALAAALNHALDAHRTRMSVHPSGAHPLSAAPETRARMSVHPSGAHPRSAPEDLVPFTRASVDRTITEELLPRLLG
ncbi:MAG: glycosyltransferase, partial [Solirubrobacterales bacterium]|nr:glycosyltransferase [Solirubrobacterales bacterium]